MVLLRNIPTQGIGLRLGDVGAERPPDTATEPSAVTVKVLFVSTPL